MSDAICPVCKRTDSVHCVYVPLGHGRYCEYLCLGCKVVFPWGSNKFGGITSTDQIKQVARVVLRWEGGNLVTPAEHPDFQPYIHCHRCKKDITLLSRAGTAAGYECHPSCK